MTSYQRIQSMQKRAPSLTKAEKTERANKAAWGSFCMMWSWLGQEIAFQANKGK